MISKHLRSNPEITLSQIEQQEVRRHVKRISATEHPENNRRLNKLQGTHMSHPHHHGDRCVGEGIPSSRSSGCCGARHCQVTHLCAPRVPPRASASPAHAPTPPLPATPRPRRSPRVGLRLAHPRAATAATSDTSPSPQIVGKEQVGQVGQRGNGGVWT